MRPPWKVERSWLYKELWNRPSTTVATCFGISSSALKRICVAMDIPTPPRGYWAKKRNRKSIVKPELPPIKNGTRKTWTIDQSLKSSCAQKKRIARESEAKKAAMGEAIIKLSTDLSKVHPLVKSTRTHLREIWSNRRWEQRKNRKRMNIKVSPATLDRACLFMDTVIRIAISKGFIFRCGLDTPQTSPLSSRFRLARASSDPVDGVCWIEIEDEKIKIALSEKNALAYRHENFRQYGRNADKIPTGLLELSLGGDYHYTGRSRWGDGKTQRIEDFISEIIASFQRIASASREIRKELEERRIIQEIKREQERKEQARKEFFIHREKLNQVALQTVIDAARVFREVCEAREYIHAVESRLILAEDSSDLATEARKWLVWANRRIDLLDPLTSAKQPWQNESYMDVINHENISPPFSEND